MANRFTHAQAVEVIKSALSSKAIELRGPGSSSKESKERAEQDATYLNALIEQMSTDKPAA